MKKLKQKLIMPIVAGILALSSGCAYQSKTNLAKNIKGLNVKTLEYPSERFHLNNRVEYIINETPKDFLLPDGTRFTSDAIMRMDESVAEESCLDNKVTFTPKNGYYAVAPVNFGVDEDNKILYLVNPKDDKNDRIFLTSEFDLPKRKINKGFGVEKIVTNQRKIDQTIYLPNEKNSYALVGTFPVYTDSSLEKLANSEPVLIMTTDLKKTHEIADYSNNKRGLKGKLNVLVKLPLAPKIIPKKLETKKPEEKKAITITNGETINEPSYQTNVVPLKKK